MIDTRGDGFKFTDPQTQCVRFDLKNDGNPGCYSWPAADSGVAFLVFDRDNDNVVDSGAELFGNFSPQPVLPASWGDGNGFTALALLNSNSDLVIDKNDPTWPQLKLWFPDHCLINPQTPCASRPSELVSLESYGIHSISVSFQPSSKVDRWGNAFAYRGKVNTNSDHQRVIYDVYLREAQQ